METGKTIKLIKKCLLSGGIILFSAMNVFAADNSLSAINIEQNGNNDYNITVKVDKKTNIKKSVKNNQLILLVNSTLPSDSMEIIYDNASNLKNVIVQKKNKHNTLISIEGDSVENAQVYTQELSTGLLKPVNENVFTAKALVSSIIGILLLLFLMSASKRRNNKYTAETAQKAVKQRRKTKANTLRKKNRVQSGNIPSIGFNVNGSFNSAKMYMSMPADLAYDEMYEEEEIRKAG